MATSSIHSEFIIEDENALDNLDMAFANPRELPKVKPVSEEEENRVFETAKKWIYSQSEK